MSFDVAITAEADGQCKDLILTIDPETPARELIDVVASKIPAGGPRSARLVRTGEEIDPTKPSGTYQLRAGDVIRLEAAGAPVQPPPTVPRSPVGLALHAVDGPHQGAWFPLDLGDNVIGREPGPAGLRIERDEAASRSHATLGIDGRGAVTVTDNGSTNGTFRNDSRVGGTAPLAVGDRLGIGDTDLVLETIDRTATTGAPEDAHLVYESGELGFNRQPRVATADPATSFTIPKPPDRPAKRRLPLAAALVPLVMGVGMFVMTKSPMYLVFTLMSPIMAVWSFVEDRRSGRKDFGKAAEEHRSMLRTTQRRIDEARAQATTWRRTRHPDLATLARRAETVSPQLWERRASDPDLLDLRVGIADQPSLVSVTAEAGGDDDLRRPAETLCEHARLDEAVPVVVPLRTLGVFGVVGTGPEVDGLLRSIVLELATLHSPRDVAVVGLAPTAPDLAAWAKWLPHVRVLSDDGSATVAVDESSTQALFEGIVKLSDARQQAAEEAIGGSLRFSPQIVLLVKPPVRIPPKEMADLLGRCTQVGISVVWFASERSELPNECQAILEIDPRREGAGLTFTATGERIDGVVIESTDGERAATVARALAPLRDVTTGSGAEGIPDRVALPEVLDLVPPTGAQVLDRWLHDNGDLDAVLGVGAFGPVSIDLRKDGPHGLVAGTTGAGKSELLQSLVASLAVSHPPTRLTFVFVDYKGGAAFQECINLPHSLGIVTDLDAHLTRRALVSLNAELRRREHLILEAGAADLRDMTNKAPDRAPASMLIIIDEFAALAREVPEFVDGVIDIAQRGRSLGIHLLLATQTPKGVISDKIQANTNLRIALRTADADESRNILERPDAALISRSTPGRAFVKTGPTEVAEIQAAYVGGTTEEAKVEPASASARTFALSMAERQAAYDAARAERTAETDLHRMVAAANAAATEAALPAPHKPWLPPLGERFTMDEVLERAPIDGEQLRLPLGVADAPERQAQYTWSLDLEELGSVVVYGGPGSGKTTLLRSVAMAAATRLSPEQVRLYALDFGSRGLLGLAALPHCGGVVTSDALDKVQRLIAMLADTAEQRRSVLGTAGAGSTVEYRRLTGEPMAEIVVLLDGFAAFWATMDPIDRSEHTETLMRLVADGKGVGLHFVITADRRSAIPPQMASTIPGRLVLRMANPDEYGNLGLRELEKAPPKAPGRAFTGDGLEVQIAAPGSTTELDGPDQLSRLESVAATLQDRFPDSDVPQVRLLPDVVHLDELRLASAGPHQVPIGLDERNLATVSIDLDADPLFLVTGPAVSGRTTTLMTLTRGLVAADPNLKAWLLTGRRSALIDAVDWDHQAVGVDAAAGLAEQLASLAEDRAAEGWRHHSLLVLDDADEFAEGTIANHLDLVQRRARDAGIIVLAAVTSFKARRLYAGWATALRNNRQGIVLQPDLETDGDVFGPRLPQRANLRLPPGRGFLVTRTGMTLIQVATPSDS